MIMSYYGSYLIMLPVLLLMMWAQFNVQNTYNKYARVMTSKGITGADAARAMMNANGLSNLPLNVIGGNALTNYFDPKSNSINLSQQVYNDRSVSSVCIACHEVGHAIQYATGYTPIKIRNAIVPAVNLSANLAWPLIILGIIMTYSSAMGDMLFNIGIILLIIVAAFHLITLPVELDASNRALNQLVALNLVDEQDYYGSKKVLCAAAMTYIAALASSVMAVLRALLIRNSRR